MGTRIALENTVKQLTSNSNVEIHGSSRGSVVVYSDKITIKLLEEHFPAHLSLEVKPYSQAVLDNIPTREVGLPQEIIEAASMGNLNKEGIQNTIEKVFSGIQLCAMNYNREENTIYFTFKNNITGAEEELLKDYLEELTPIECKCMIL